MSCPLLAARELVLPRLGQPLTRGISEERLVKRPGDAPLVDAERQVEIGVEEDLVEVEVDVEGVLDGNPAGGLLVGLLDGERLERFPPDALEEGVPEPRSHLALDVKGREGHASAEGTQARTSW